MKLSVRGFTLVEIMIVVAIIALLAAIAIPNVLRGRTTANEAAAIGNMRALVSSLEMYRSVYSAYPAAWQGDMYTNANPAFGPPSFGVALANGSNNLIQGFAYTYNRNTAQTYVLRAGPEVAGRTGTRGFFVDDSGTIRHCSTTTNNGTANATSNTIDAQPSSGC